MAPLHGIVTAECHCGGVCCSRIAAGIKHPVNTTATLMDQQPLIDKQVFY